MAEMHRERLDEAFGKAQEYVRLARIRKGDAW